MSIQAGDFSYLGVGKVYIREYGAQAPMLHIGNVSAVDLGVTTDTKEQRDYTTVGGGTVAEVHRISGVELSVTLHDLDKGNISRAFLGTASSVAAGTVTNEAVVAYVGGLIPLMHPVDTTQAATVVNGATTYVAGDDYELSSGGIIILSGGDIDDGDTLSVTYKRLAHDNIEAITDNAKEYEIYFEGMNEAKDGRPVNVHIYRTKLSPTDKLSLINDDFASFTVKSKLLRDNSKSGVGISKYFKTQIVTGE